MPRTCKACGRVLKNYIGLELHLRRCAVRLGVSRRRIPRQDNRAVNAEHIEDSDEKTVDADMTVNDPQWEYETEWGADVHVNDFIHIHQVIQ